MATPPYRFAAPILLTITVLDFGCPIWWSVNSTIPGHLIIPATSMQLVG
ncbi:hypothetical protein [[Phormidium] sp. ETS-05]|nr:hypothetical protein [[Phormidium] sp. ETS-05]